MDKKNGILIVSLIVLVVSILAIIIFMNKDSSKNLDEMTAFNYYSGSSGYAIEVNGTVQDEVVNISFKEYDGANQNVSDLVISFNELKELIESTKEEDCKKHTYDYQCGDMDGCSYSSFSVSFSDNEVCYKITAEISDFFDNLK